jgi:hypothetical protein
VLLEVSSITALYTVTAQRQGEGQPNQPVSFRKHPPRRPKTTIPPLRDLKKVS